MRVLGAMLLGCALLLPATSSADSSEKRADMSMLEDSLLQILEGEDYLDLGVADEETPAVAEENAVDLRGEAGEGLIKKTGCEGHQQGDQWGSSDHDNCICGGADRFCYPVVCLPGSQMKADSNGLWNCEVDSSKTDITGSALNVTEREKRFAVEFGVFTGVVGLVGFLLDRVESAQTTQQLNEIQGQLNEIQGQIRELDRKIDDLTRSVSDLQLGQQYLQQVILYGREERRLKNVLDTLSRMRIRNGQYAGSDIQGWADSVLSHGSDGIRNVLLNMLNMVKPQSSVFGGKSLFDIYHQQLNKGGLEQYSIKMRQKAAQVYGLIGGGYCAWIAALRIKGRQGEITAKVREGERELSSVKESLQKYLVYVNKWRADAHCGGSYTIADGSTAECNPDGMYPCCSPYNWCGNTAAHCDCADCVDYRPVVPAKMWRDDLRCGWGFPAENGKDAECNPDGIIPCCSPGNWCGNTADHCDCPGCVDYRNMRVASEKMWRDDWRCGRGFPAENGKDAECDPDGIIPCCSPGNWCGYTVDHCDCPGCVDYRNMRGAGL
ncbi:PREDICTED: uncharacterized protein LOC109475692 [Branchiostoma belcheri]|uniref:Uncharacterized protein LOC109475692 n=1 Tax=Branchiostoma belcheri TaxID=7741 RepID=A0A6P4Z5W8_BRABE|nr:PREDICTED: uncharacterized protein LOC109475692 [Branchiostoma belcheri]